MGVHAAAVDAENRLRHERRVQAVAIGDVLHHEPERAHVIRRDQRIVVTEIDLVLAWSHFMMCSLDMKPHLLERKDDLAADVLAQIDRRQWHGHAQLGYRSRAVQLLQHR